MLHSTGKAGGKRNQPTAVRPEKLLVYSRLIVIAFRKSSGYDLDQVLISVIILCQKNQMPLIFISVSIFIMHGPCGCIDLTADYRLNSLLFTLFIKIDHTEHHAVIGNRKRIHAQLLCPRHHIGDSGSSVQQTVFRMNM